MVLDTLLIDTCTEWGFVAFARAEEILFSLPLHGRAGAQDLVPLLAAELDRRALSLQTVGLIGVTVGPGSYTGIRLGVIAAKMWAYTLGVPLASVASLNIYQPPMPFQGTFAVLLDARMGGVYVALHTYTATTVTVEPPSVCPIGELAAYLAPHTNVIVTPHQLQLQPRLLALGEGTQWQWHTALPQADLLLKATLQAYIAGHCSHSAMAAIHYLRLTQAELEREQRAEHLKSS